MMGHEPGQCLNDDVIRGLLVYAWTKILDEGRTETQEAV